MFTSFCPRMASSTSPSASALISWPRFAPPGIGSGRVSSARRACAHAGAPAKPAASTPWSSSASTAETGMLGSPLAGATSWFCTSRSTASPSVRRFMPPTSSTPASACGSGGSLATAPGTITNWLLASSRIAALRTRSRGSPAASATAAGVTGPAAPRSMSAS